MKKLYEKPIAEQIDFDINNRIMDIGDYSEGNEDAGDEQPI